MSLYRVEPLGPHADLLVAAYKRSDFSATWSSTHELLGRELRALRARDVVLQMDVMPGQIRLDGELKANAVVASHAVRITFESKEGKLAYGTAQFSHWQDNVRAIALALEALRKVDRYGIAKGAQYAGYRELPSGSGQAAVAVGGMTSDQARQILHNYAEGQIVTGWTDRDYWKNARAYAHPDKRGGLRDAWDQVEQAAHVLGLDA